MKATLILLVFALVACEKREPVSHIPREER
jgi:hypothetical protein